MPKLRIIIEDINEIQAALLHREIASIPGVKLTVEQVPVNWKGEPTTLEAMDAQMGYKPVAGPPLAKCGYCDAMVVESCGSRAQSQQCELPPGTEFRISMGLGSDTVTMFGRRVLGKTEFDPPRVVMPELTPEQQKAFEEEWTKPGHITWVDGRTPLRPMGTGIREHDIIGSWAAGEIVDGDTVDPGQAIGDASTVEAASAPPEALYLRICDDAATLMNLLLQARSQTEAEGAHTEAANAEIDRLNKMISRHVSNCQAQASADLGEIERLKAELAVWKV